MSRAEFTKPTKRAALQRAGNRCEATGALYGLPPSQRCNADLAHGVEFDHLILDANSKDNSLENCVAACTKCHRWKTSNHDVPLAAKTLRQQDRHRGIRPKSKFPCGRSSSFRKKINGQVVRRATGDPLGRGK